MIDLPNTPLVGLCWRMTFLVEECVSHAIFPMSFDSALPSQQP
jgi:hypothetical protein